jgi:GSH-dependent disulfide-bond oxidoreductase
MRRMIDAYVWTTPNGYKALIALEELGLPYTTHWIDIGKGEQNSPEFLAINPNNKIPAIVDHEGPAGLPQAVFESGAVLIYLADKTKQLLAEDGVARYVALQWTFFNVGGTAPIVGQLAHFSKYAPEKIPYAIDRYTKETERLLHVLDNRLGEVRYLAGEYSIADIMNATWARAAGAFGIDLRRHAHVTRWLDEIEARPAVARALALKPQS